jgi:hypothetical protein
MKNNAKVGGILSIVAGGWGILSAFAMIIMGIAALIMRSNSYADYYPGWADYFVGVFLLIFGICWGLLGAFAIVGGAFGIRKKLWGLALAGSIASVLTFWLCGIPAVIFTAIGKSEFNSKATPETPSPPIEKIVG